MKKILLLLTLSLVAQMNFAQNVPSYVPTDGLVGYWGFNGNANDESGNANNGTVNGATLTTNRFGYSNSAYNFNGISNYIQTNFHGILDNNFRTISFWAKSTSSSEMAAFSYGGYSVKGDRFDGYFNFNGLGCTANIGGAAVSYSTPSQVNDNNWHNYIYVVEKINSQAINIKIYQDGILLTNVISSYFPNTPLITVNGIGLRFGKTTYAGIPSYFNGNLDDIGFWNRALSQQEITTMYYANQCITNITVTDTLIINIGQLSFNDPVTWSNNITIAPNPANSQININFNNITNLNGGTLKVINSSGQQVATTQITTSGTNSAMLLATWGAAGMYFVQIINPQGQIVDIKKIILQ